jgi:hypothetical protein
MMGGQSEARVPDECELTGVPRAPRGTRKRRRIVIERCAGEDPNLPHELVIVIDEP